MQPVGESKFCSDTGCGNLSGDVCRASLRSSFHKDDAQIRREKFTFEEFLARVVRRSQHLAQTAHHTR
jgi:hypothetical protein